MFENCYKENKYLEISTYTQFSSKMEPFITRARSNTKRAGEQWTRKAIVLNNLLSSYISAEKVNICLMLTQYKILNIRVFTKFSHYYQVASAKSGRAGRWRSAPPPRTSCGSCGSAPRPWTRRPARRPWTGSAPTRRGATARPELSTNLREVFTVPGEGFKDLF